MAGRRLLGPEPRGLTVKGLGSTLRARWLASHRPGFARPAGGKGGKALVRRSVVPDRVGPMMQTPIIAAGAGVIELKPMRLAMAPFPGLAMGPDPNGAKSAALAPGVGAALPPLPATACASETQRIAAYATGIAQGVAAGPDADLALFDVDGRPTPNFARALFNMAAVEIGPLKARQTLVDAGLALLPPRPVKTPDP
jgi:hypothetical protein